MMTTKFHSSIWHGSWRFTACLVNFEVISTAFNLQSQSNVARDPFASNPPSPAEMAAEAEATKLFQIQAMLERRDDEQMFSESRLQKRLDMIQTYPELGKYLPKIADQMIVQRSPQIGDVLDAMSMRADVPPAATAHYIELAKHIIKGKTAKDISDVFEQEFLSGITKVLAAHLTPENEDLLIALLRFGTNGYAQRALGRVGTIRSLPAMQKYADDYELYARTQDDASVSEWLKEIKGSLLALSKRVSDAKQGIGHTNQPRDAKGLKTAQHTTGESTGSIRVSQEWNIIMIVTAVGGLIWIGILASKRQKSKTKNQGE